MPSDNAVRERLVVPQHYTEQDILNQLVVYHRNIGGIEECFRANSYKFNVDQPKGDVFHQGLNFSWWNLKFYYLTKTLRFFFKLKVFEFVTRPARSAAPITPRILLLGPRGAGKRTQAANLAMKYGIVHGNMLWIFL
jgi:adenylate kinase